MPVTIFHGNQDTVIPYESSLRLREEFKSKVYLITLDGLGHNEITKNDYDNMVDDEERESYDEEAIIEFGSVKAKEIKLGRIDK